MNIRSSKQRYLLTLLLCTFLPLTNAHSRTLAQAVPRPQISLTKDIAPGTTGSYPGYMTDVNGTAFLIANDGISGYELWKSNGTASSTILVKDVYPGVNSGASHTGKIGNKSLFIGLTASGGSLYTSDGTASGTVPIYSGLAFGGSFSEEINGVVYFEGGTSATGGEPF